jgi:hypothetical protein
VKEACFPFHIDFMYGTKAGLLAGVRELLKMIFPVFLAHLPTRTMITFEPYIHWVRLIHDSKA